MDRQFSPLRFSVDGWIADVRLTRMVSTATPPEDELIAAHMQILGYALQRLHTAYHRRLSEVLEGTGLHAGHTGILASLWQRAEAARSRQQDAGLTQTQLSRASQIEKSSVVTFLDYLQTEGWVERRKHASDRRKHLVYLTEDGALRFLELAQRLGRFEDDMLRDLRAGDRRRLLEDLATVLARLED